MLPRLYVITGGNIEACLAAADAGARFFQIRCKGLQSDQYWPVAERVAVALAGYDPLLVINDRADIALALGCDGVHRPQAGLPFTALRRLLEYRLIGVSCHDTAELLEADEDGADFVTFGPVFETTSKPDATPTGLQALSAACKLVDCPVYALGGVTPENVADCIAAGAHGVAVLSGIMLAGDPFEATHGYLSALASVGEP